MKTVLKESAIGCMYLQMTEEKESYFTVLEIEMVGGIAHCFSKKEYGTRKQAEGRYRRLIKKYRGEL